MVSLSNHEAWCGAALIQILARNGAVLVAEAGGGENFRIEQPRIEAA